MLDPEPLIIAYYDGDPEVKVLSNFAHTPFDLDGVHYESSEGFWQCLKTPDPIMRQKIARTQDGYDAKQMGRMVAIPSKTFQYLDQTYAIGSVAHHVLLERALRAKTAQNESVEECLWHSGYRPLKHMLKNKQGRWKPGNSTALPASVFEDMWHRIRNELREKEFMPEIGIPPGLPTIDDIFKFD